MMVAHWPISLKLNEITTSKPLLDSGREPLALSDANVAAAEVETLPIVMSAAVLVGAVVSRGNRAGVDPDFSRYLSNSPDHRSHARIELPDPGARLHVHVVMGGISATIVHSAANLGEVIASDVLSIALGENGQGTRVQAARRTPARAISR
jgi:hypothetical protein